MQVIKRDGSEQEFCIDKIVNAVKKANSSVNQVDQMSENDIFDLVSDVKALIGEVGSIDVESIQNIIERKLMERGWYAVAKDYILYRESHKRSRFMDEKLNYIYNYIDSDDSATNLSNTDDNANSSKKTVSTMEGELYKNTNRDIQRRIMKRLLKKIKSPYVDQYVEDLEHNILYQHDETGLLKPYCSAYTLYPMHIDGTSNIDGTKNKAPKHLSSFVGQFQNLVFLLSAQKKGAGAYGEFFNFFSYYCEKEWGCDYYKREDEVVTSDTCLHKMTIGSTIDQYFQSITYYINQPASNRGWQSPFTNFNVFDSYYWDQLFNHFVFDDGSKPNWDAVNWLQKRYMKWLNKERTKTLLTFPVMTVCLLTDGNDIVDKEYKDFVTTQWEEGDSFFVYMSENVDSISSCCRLKNEISDNTFSSTTGLTGVQTGSCNVMTLNLNRIVQDCYRKYFTEFSDDGRAVNVKDTNYFSLLENYLKDILIRVYDYQKAYKTGLYTMDEKGLLPQTTAGYISLSRLYSTIGVNGINEAARFLGFSVSNNKDYMNFSAWILGVINNFNKEHTSRKFMYNLELVPAESLGAKNYKKDKQDGYWVPDDVNLYNSYIYDAHDSNTSILDKIEMQGGQISKNITGGQASHLNLEENLSKEQYTKLLEYAVKCGNNYITFNVPQTQCDDCGFIAKHPFDECPECGSTHTTKWTRVIGYLRPTKTWSKDRQEEYTYRYFAKSEQLGGAI